MYPWFQSIEQQVLKSVNANRLAHGLLLDAPAGSGKLDFARELAQWLLCNQSNDHQVSGCGTCKSCQLFSAESHPDYYLLDRLVDSKGKSKQSIGIDQIRTLTEKLIASPQLSGWRVAVIRSVGDLTSASFNALLKTLEEPGKNTLLILLTHNLQKVPATIKSRCQILKPELSLQSIAGWVKNKFPDVNDQVLKEILKDCDNAPLKAVSLIESEFTAEKSSFYRQMDDLLTNKVTPNEVLNVIELNSNLWLILSGYFQQKASMKLTTEQAQGILSALDIHFVFELYDQVIAFQKGQFAGSNLQEKLQFQAILIKWYEIGRKLIHISKS